MFPVFISFFINDYKSATLVQEILLFTPFPIYILLQEILLLHCSLPIALCFVRTHAHTQMKLWPKDKGKGKKERPMYAFPEQNYIPSTVLFIKTAQR